MAADGENSTEATQKLLAQTNISNDTAPTPPYVQTHKLNAHTQTISENTISAKYLLYLPILSHLRC